MHSGLNSRHYRELVKMAAARVMYSELYKNAGIREWLIEFLSKGARQPSTLGRLAKGTGRTLGKSLLYGGAGTVGGVLGATLTLGALALAAKKALEGSPVAALLRMPPARNDQEA